MEHGIYVGKIVLHSTVKDNSMAIVIASLNGFFYLIEDKIKIGRALPLNSFRTRVGNNERRAEKPETRGLINPNDIRS